jgi:hypothetical protein
MKTKRLLARLAALLIPAVTIWAAPLTETTAVHTRPDTTSPAITFLKAGTEPTPMPGSIASTPAGWIAIELPGPFEGYVENKDLTKSLDVRPGVAIRTAPKADAPVLTNSLEKDKTTITGLHGRWTQINLERPLVGYVNIGTAPGYMPSIATTPAAAPGAAASSGAPVAPAPVTPTAYGTSAAGQPAPMVNLGDGGAAALPRQFAGKFVSTRRPLMPRRPYDYALNDDAGKRYAYLDASKLMLTEQLDKYIDHSVVIFGTARTSAGTNDLVIQIESLQLK